MKVLIDIPDKDIPKQQELISVNFTFMDGILCECDYLFDVVEECGDCVNRQALIEKATSWDKHFTDSERYVSLTDILALPPVTAKQRTGQWEIDKLTQNSFGDDAYVCSVCETIWNSSKIINMHYCPTCGAKMGGE